MGQYLIRRLLQAIPLLFLLSIFMFLLIHALPGGADAVIFNPHLDAAGRAALRARFGLDQPLPIQYLRWLGNILRGDFGSSFATNQPVSQILGQRFPNTLELFGVALGIALILAILLGVISALRQNTATDYALTILAYFGISMPAFLLGLFLQDIFGTQLHLLPVSGTQTLGYTFDPFNALYDHVLGRMRYDKSGTGWGNGDAIWACTAKRGNCTDFHSLFIGMMRAAGIPARFEIGFPLPTDQHDGVIPGYHCWAEFYVEPYDWIPVDASEAWKHLEKKDYFFGAHDDNRVQFTLGRDIRLDPPQHAGPLNYFIYPYAELDGKPLALTSKFSFQDE